MKLKFLLTCRYASEQIFLQKCSVNDRKLLACSHGMLKVLQYNKYNQLLHSPNQRGAGSYQLWRETCCEMAFTTNREKLKYYPTKGRCASLCCRQNHPQGTPPPVSPALLLPSPVLPGGLHQQKL